MSSATYCQPGGGCERVQHWAAHAGGLPIGSLLPLVGLLGFSTLFAGSMIRERRGSSVFAVMAILGGLVAIILLWVQGALVGAWCGLCVGVDLFAVGAGIAGAAILFLARRSDVKGSELKSPWWSAWVLAAIGPIAFSATFPDGPVPRPIRAHYRDGVANVVEMVDFECPFCRRMHPVLRRAIDAHDGEVNFVRIVVPLSFHVHARDAAHAYMCAIRFDKGEAMADALFASEDLSRAGIIAAGRRLDINAEELEHCLDEPSIEEQVQEHERLAMRSSFEGLPTVYIGERTFIGFDERVAEAQFRDALRAARSGGRPRVRYWPLTMLAGAALLALVIGWRRTAR